MSIHKDSWEIWVSLWEKKIQHGKGEEKPYKCWV